jgi:hypothetical protein
VEKRHCRRPAQAGSRERQAAGKTEAVTRWDHSLSVALIWCQHVLKQTLTLIEWRIT